MKPGFGKIIFIALIPIILEMAAANKAACQTTMGVLPVNINSSGSTLSDSGQWQSISVQIQDFLIEKLSGLGTVVKLSHEHILLLLKGSASTDPGNPGQDDYLTICKKENLQYLLKCTVESIKVDGKNVLAPVRIIVVDGRTGKVFWEEVMNKYRSLPATEVSEQIILENIVKPALKELSQEIINLNY